MGKRLICLLAIVMSLNAAAAKKHTFTLRADEFKGAKYNFGVYKIIDRRIDSSHPIGYLNRGFGREEMLNDTLEQNLNAFFDANRRIFNPQNKLIVVINQIKFRSLYLGPRNDFFTVFVALDYYKTANGTCSLIYQQYVGSTENIPKVMSVDKGLSTTFSKALKKGFDLFNAELSKVIQLSEWDTPMDSLLAKPASKPSRIMDSVNVKDGIYFSPKDLYLNNPGHVTNWEMPAIDSLGARAAEIISDYKIEQVFAIVKNREIYIFEGKDKLGNKVYRRVYFDNKSNLYFDGMRRTIPKGSGTKKVAGVVAGDMVVGGIVGSLLKRGIKKAVDKSAKINLARVNLDLATFEYTYADEAI